MRVDHGRRNICVSWRDGSTRRGFPAASVPLESAAFSICHLPLFHVSQPAEEVCPRKTGKKSHTFHSVAEIYRTRSPWKVGNCRIRQFPKQQFRRTLNADPEGKTSLNVCRSLPLGDLTRSPEKGRLNSELTRPYRRIPQNGCSRPECSHGDEGLPAMPFVPCTFWVHLSEGIQPECVTRELLSNWVGW